MDEINAERVFALFNAVVELPAAEQEAFLEQECAGNLALLTELRGLLAADERVGAMTARPLVDELAQLFLDATPESSFSNLRVGPFEVGEELGHGGMGVVYRAHRVDGNVEQQVAIKFVRRELLDSQMRSRFLLERRALAAMDHPNIARLIDAAELDDGTPYYVMEYVEGASITEYCERQRLGIRERIALFRTVCDAVAHAHRSLVVHRDLKPGNILVTPDGVPKLLDFGIAKLLKSGTPSSAAEHTATEHRYFSPLYAAPEQLLGEPIGVGCDVYALGLLLCECLTGARAFDFTNLSAGQIERLITSVPPAPPSQIAAKQGAPAQVQRQLRGDLDGIVLRCLRKSVSERYSSVEQLAADLENFLDGRPVQARGGHLWYRARKFVRRNLIPVVSGSLAVLALIGGVVGFATQARIAESRAAELEQVSTFQAEMLATLDPASAGVLLSKNVLTDYAAALEAPGVSESERTDRLNAFKAQWQQLNATDLARQLVDDTLIKPAIVAIDGEFNDQPVVAARLYRGLAETYSNIGPDSAALPLLQQALTLQRNALGDDHPETLMTLNWLGIVHFNRREHEQAREIYLTALDRRRRVLGSDHEDTIQTIVSLSGSLARLGKFDEAEPLVKEALERARRALGEDHIQTLYAVETLGNNFLTQARPAEAEPYLRRVLEARERIFGQDHEQTLVVLGNLVFALVEQGKSAEAEPYSLQRLHRGQRAQGDIHPFTSSALLNHGMLLQRLGRLGESEEYLRQALQSRLQVYGPARVETLWVRNRLGMTLQVQGKLADAEPFYAETLELGRSNLGDSHPETLIALQNLASLRLLQGHADEASTLLAPAEEATREAFGTGQRTGKRTARYLLYLGTARSQMGEFVAAEETLLEAHRLFESVIDMEHIEADCRAAIEELYNNWQLTQPSDELTRRAAAWRRSVKTDASPAASD